MKNFLEKRDKLKEITPEMWHCPQWKTAEEREIGSWLMLEIMRQVSQMLRRFSVEVGALKFAASLARHSSFKERALWVNWWLHCSIFKEGFCRRRAGSTLVGSSHGPHPQRVNFPCTFPWHPPDPWSGRHLINGQRHSWRSRHQRWRPHPPSRWSLLGTCHIPGTLLASKYAVFRALNSSYGTLGNFRKMCPFSSTLPP